MGSMRDPVFLIMAVKLSLYLADVLGLSLAV